MLARRLPSILPPLTRAEAIEVTRIHSVAGLHAGAGLVDRAPVPRAAPHDLGRRPGRRRLAPGAGRGDARPPRRAVPRRAVGVPAAGLEALRQPLEDGRVAIVRGQRACVFPTRFMLVAATNPCPCGYAPTRRCRCTRGRARAPPAPAQRPAARPHRPARRRPAPRRRELSRGPPTASSATERARASLAARERQARAPRGDRRRLQRADGRAAAAPRTSRLAPTPSAPLLRAPTTAGDLSARGHHRVAAGRADDRRPRRARRGRAPSTSSAALGYARSEPRRRRWRRERRADGGCGRATPACARTWLARARSPARIEIAAARAAAPLRELLALPDERAARGARRRGAAARSSAALERFDPDALRERCRARRAGRRLPARRGLPGAPARPRRRARARAARRGRPAAAASARRRRAARSRSSARAARRAVRARGRARARARPRRGRRDRRQRAWRWASTRAAHAGALEAGGPTVAVLAGGADVPYPREQARACTARSPSAAAWSPRCRRASRRCRWCFPARNRIIAGARRA